MPTILTTPTPCTDEAAPATRPALALTPFVAVVVRVDAAGQPWLDISGAASGPCECLDVVSPLVAGDRTLATWVQGQRQPVVIGRIGTPRPRLQLKASEALLLSCGDASLELRADGKVLLKGEEVVVRAKGTQRIRAAHVSIN